MIQIDKEIPIPPTLGRGGMKGTSSYPVAMMDIGDSFVVPRKSQLSACSVAAKRIGRKVTYRTMGDGTFRVWRIA